MVVENDVSSAATESPISVQLGWDVVSETAMAVYIVFMLIKPFSGHNQPFSDAKHDGMLIA